MKISSVVCNLFISIIVMVSPACFAKEAETQVALGKLIYERQCAPCHARGRGAGGETMLPGPASLVIKYQGIEPSPYIDERPDLANFNVLRVFLRQGSVSMPPFRKSELPDTDIEAIAAYFIDNTIE